MQTYSYSLRDKLKNWREHIEAAFRYQPYFAYPLLALFVAAVAIPVAVLYYQPHRATVTNPNPNSTSTHTGSSGSKSGKNSNSGSGSASSSSSSSSSGSGSSGGSSGSSHLYSQTPRTWGFIGCSNTHDIMWGYQNVSSSRLFWPASFGNTQDTDPYNIGHYDYKLEGQTVQRWADSSDPHYANNWAMFDRMKQTYNGGQDPPVIWVQLCENVNYTEPGTYHITTYTDIVNLINSIRAHAPTSVIYLSPLNTWVKNPDGTWRCTLENGQRSQDPSDGIVHMTGLIDQAVNDKSLNVLAGPGAAGLSYLGPLSINQIDAGDTSQCHPNGNPIHPPLDGPGSPFLGGQLADFIDKL